MFLGLFTSPAKIRMDSDLEAMHTRMYALLRWRTYIKPFQKSLEHPAPNNGADTHKLTTLYTCTHRRLFCPNINKPLA